MLIGFHKPIFFFIGVIMKKNFLLIFILAFAFCYISCSSETKTLTIKPSKLDFSDVYLGDSVTKTFEIINKYGKDITVLALLITGSNDFQFVSGNNTPLILLKGESNLIEISFTPTTNGPINAMLEISHDASSKPKQADLLGLGVAVPRINLSDTSFDFDKKLINKTHTHDLDIENVGTSDLEISNLTFIGLGAPLYSISAGGPAPFYVAPGTTKTITIAFNPVVIGNYAADLQIYHNAVNEASPIVYPITAEAIDVDPQITLSQTSPWDFGSVASTMPATQICEIENTGIDPLTITSATLATGTVFTIDSLKDSNGNVINLPQVIAVSAKIMLAIKFEPTATTTYNDTLTIIHDGTNEVSPLDISITGEGRLIIIKTFTYTGSAQQWTVPAGVISIDIDAYGAEGGKGQRGSAVNQYPGKGGRVQATISVTPGDTLNIYIGEKGKDANNSASGGGVGGWNGGGNGSTYSTGGGGGGGGASDIREVGTDLTDRIIVAGAGGGSGCNYSTGDAGGKGGGLVGGNGYSTNPASYHGYGGTQTAPGTLRGALGIGGSGDPGSRTGGGGGGGYYGGGGSTWMGAGGGSSFTKIGATNVVHTQDIRASNGEIKITY